MGEHADSNGGTPMPTEFCEFYCKIYYSRNLPYGSEDPVGVFHKCTKLDYPVIYCKSHGRLPCQGGEP